MQQITGKRAAHNTNLRRKHVHGGFDRIIRCANGLRLHKQAATRQGQIAAFAIAIIDTCQSYQIQSHAKGQGNFAQTNFSAEDIQVETSSLDFKLADQDLPGAGCIAEGKTLPGVQMR